jgi:hypothetical protein
MRGACGKCGCQLFSHDKAVAALEERLSRTKKTPGWGVGGGGAEVVVSGHPPGRDGGVAATPRAHTTSSLSLGELTE